MTRPLSPPLVFLLGELTVVALLEVLPRLVSVVAGRRLRWL